MSGSGNPSRIHPRSGPRSVLRRLLAERQGFMLLAAVMLLAGATVAVTVVTVTHARYRDARSISGAVEGLRGLETAIKQFQLDTKAYPGSLRDLNYAITPSGKNACGQAYGQAAANGWKGPYYAGSVGADGVRLVGFGRVMVAPERSPPSQAGGKDAVLRLRLEYVRERSIARLDSIFDEIDDRENGTWKSNGLIQWGAVVDQQTGFVNSASYEFPVSGC